MKLPTDTDASAFRLDDSLGFVLHKTLSAVKSTVRRVFSEKGCDVTVDQWVILCALWEEDGCSQASLSERTFKDPPTVTRMLDLLERKQMVVRRPSPTDRRMVEVYLTPEGRAFRQKLVPVVIDLHRDILRGLSAAEVRHLYAILHHIFQNVQPPER
jgi:DNA-binding MarR family transcriptional regulator